MVRVIFNTRPTIINIDEAGVCMFSKPMWRTILILVIIVTNFGCDQVTKTIVRENISQQEMITVFSNHFTVTNVENSGAFLSLGTSMPQRAKNMLLSFLPALVIMAALYYILTRHGLPQILLFGFCCIIGGGIGNIFDRIAYGSVTDFMHLRFGTFQTGIFNMADVSITAGTLIILLYQLFRKKSVA